MKNESGMEQVGASLGLTGFSVLVCYKTKKIGVLCGWLSWLG